VIEMDFGHATLVIPADAAIGGESRDSDTGCRPSASPGMTGLVQFS
jgi:hypothetical protein